MPIRRRSTARPPTFSPGELWLLVTGRTPTREECADWPSAYMPRDQEQALRAVWDRLSAPERRAWVRSVPGLEEADPCR